MAGPKVEKSVTKQITSTVTYKFSHAELCKRLRLPEGAKLSAVVVTAGVGATRADVTEGLTAEVTTESTK